MALPYKGNGGRFNPKYNKQKEALHRINERIHAPEVRLVGENVTVGIYPIQQALKIARDSELDLVEISPNANPPVCKVIDYKKFLFEKKRKEKEMKSNAKQSEVKEIRFTPGTDEHDFDFKSKHAERFLKEGNKVKAYVQFRGRAIMFKERGELVLLKFADRLSEVGQPEAMPKLEGKRMYLMLTPKTGKKKVATPKPQSQQQAPTKPIAEKKPSTDAPVD